MKPRFSTLILLTVLTAIILVPFALSSAYMPMLRDRAFELYELFRTDVYKQATGFVLLALVLAEMGLSLRKRGRKWKVKLPGTMMMWRSLHIFLGVFLIAAVLVHTVGATGLNFNAIFLWVFFGVSLSALVGVVAETGILETDVVRMMQLRLMRRNGWVTPSSAATSATVSEGMAVQASHRRVNAYAPERSMGGDGASTIAASSPSVTVQGVNGPQESVFTPEGAAKLPWVIAALSKGPIIRGLRAIWLSSHIFLVSVFTIMLGFHIFLAYYYQ
ncbi:MAG: hypothetical protein AAFU78_07110 [Cyanobacteria bacterium J06633_2]